MTSRRSPEGRGRIAVADRLGERGEVGLDPEVLGGAAAGDPEAGLDLVEDQQRPELLGDRPDALVEALLGQDPLGVAEDRLDDHRGDVVALGLEHPAEGGQVVVGHRDHRLGDRLGNAPAPGQVDRVVAVAQLVHVVGQDADQGVVVDAVVLALELDDLLAAGVGPGDPHQVHRGFGARDGHPGHLDPAGDLADQLTGPDLILAGQREADAQAHPLVDVVVDARVGVAEHDRPVAEAQVDVLVAVHVPDPAALAPIDVDRVLAPCPEVRIGAAGHGLERPVVELGLAFALEGRRWADGGFGGHGSLR